MTAVYENYRDYDPPHFVRPTVTKLLAGLPQNHLSSLYSVVLTNSAAIGKGKTRRVSGKKHLRRECLGFYHAAYKSEPPSVDLLVDNILAASSRDGAAVLMAFPICREMAFARTLFHEVGHHLDHTIGAPAPTGEAAAEKWCDLLMRSYLRTHWSPRSLRIAAGLMKHLGIVPKSTAARS